MQKTPIRFRAMFLVLLFSSSAVPAETADRIFYGDAIYTMDPARPWAEALVVRDGRIVYVGDGDGARSWEGTHTRIVKLGGRMLLPGFHDSHVHPMAGGLRFRECQLYGLEWPEAVVAKLTQCLAGLEDGDWLRGIGLSETVFEGVGPRRERLDALAGDRPAFIRSDDGFSVWVNTRTLEIAGIDRATPDPEHGRIERDSDGMPSGTLRHAGAALAYGHLPEPGAKAYREALRAASRIANRYGITSVIDSSVSPPMLEAYRQADAAGELTVRVVASQRYGGQRGLADLDALVSERDRSRGRLLSAGAVKIFADGDVVQRTAAMIEPYAGGTRNRGKLTMPAPVLDRLVRNLDATGFQVHAHATGDRTTRILLDTFCALAAQGNTRRHHIAHLKFVDPADIARFRRCGVTANFQALWAQSADPDLRDSIAMVGENRARWMYAIGSMLDTGTRVVAGSDWPSPSLSPLVGIQIALTRQPIDGSLAPFQPQQRVTLDAMLRAYTIDGAWLVGGEELHGSLEVGKAADLVVLDRNLFELAPARIAAASVLLTLLEGNPVYRDPSFDW